MITIQIIILFVSVMVLLLTLPAMLTLGHQWRHYKRVYETLSSQTFYRDRDQVYNYSLHNPVDDNNVIVWFSNGGEFQLAKNVYLHNTIVTILDPYSCYWYLKYRKWFKENIDINKIEKF